VRYKFTMVHDLLSRNAGTPGLRKRSTPSRRTTGAVMQETAKGILVAVEGLPPTATATSVGMMDRKPVIRTVAELSTGPVVEPPSERDRICVKDLHVSFRLSLSLRTS